MFICLHAFSGSNIRLLYQDFGSMESFQMTDCDDECSLLVMTALTSFFSYCCSSLMMMPALSFPFRLVSLDLRAQERKRYRGIAATTCRGSGDSTKVLHSPLECSLSLRSRKGGTLAMSSRAWKEDVKADYEEEEPRLAKTTLDRAPGAVVQVWKRMLESLNCSGGEAEQRLDFLKFQ
ncbi:unnamed protein product [Amoebophrya sp. A120]|nr:unnamed protein product [Amoebophrya sp. A120]|eukprot:GSA120T00008828001.1